MDDRSQLNRAAAIVEGRFAREAPGAWHALGIALGIVICAIVFLILTPGVKPRSGDGANFAQALIGFLVSCGPPFAVGLIWERRERTIIEGAVAAGGKVRPKTLKSTLVGWSLGFAALGIGQALCAWARLPAFGS
jgi:hypothetical protein